MALHELLRECTLAISGTARGTAVVVGPDLAITCAHVVGPPGSKVSARDGDLTVVLALPELDLALLRMANPVEQWALLGPSPPVGTELWAWGHPGGDYRAGDSLTLTFEGPSQLGEETLLKLGHGQVVRGFSGAPLLSPVSGTVCGVLRFSRDVAQSLGGRAIPTSVIVEAFSDVRKAQENPWRTNERWLSLLDDDQLRAAELPYAGPRLRVYLEAVRQTARTHPYGLLPGGPRLDVVYVRQVAGRREEGAPPTLVDAETGLLRDSGALLMGGPGMGKSSVLRRLADVLATRLLSGDDVALVPVQIPARALASPHPLPTAIGSAAAAALGTLDSGRPLPEFLEHEPFPLARWLVLVDGLDEILDPADRQAAVRAIALWRSDSRYRFIVATRQLLAHELDPLSRDLPRYDIEPFGEGQLVKFAAGWFNALGLPDPEKLASYISARLLDGRLLDLARTPLIASMACQAFAAKPGQVADNRMDLYERYVGLMLAKAREGVAERTFARLPSLLAYLAHRRQNDGAEALLSEAAERTHDLAPAGSPLAVWRDTLVDLLRRTGLVIIRGDEIEFAHQTFQEYLAALHNKDVVPGRRARRELQSMARQGNSYALFRAGALVASGHDIYGTAPFNIGSRRFDHARFVAQMIQQGAGCPAETATWAKARLTSIATDERRESDLRIRAAVGMEKIQPGGRGADILRAIAGEPTIDISYRAEAALGLVDTDRTSAADIIDRLMDDRDASNTRPRFLMMAALRLLDIDPDRGLRALTKLAGRTHYRWEAISVIQKLHPERTADLLERAVHTSFRVTDEQSDRTLAVDRLAALDRQRAADALVAIIRDESVHDDYIDMAVTLLMGIDITQTTDVVSDMVSRTDVSGQRRLAAARTLNLYTAGGAMDLLARIVGDPTVHIDDRAEACEAIDEFDRPRATALHRELDQA